MGFAVALADETEELEQQLEQFLLTNQLLAAEQVQNTLNFIFSVATVIFWTEESNCLETESLLGANK